MTEDYHPISKAIIQEIAKLNAAGDALDKYSLYIDFEAKELEITEGETLPTKIKKWFLFGTLDQIDPSAFLVETDAESKFVIDCLADIIESTLEYTDEGDDE